MPVVDLLLHGVVRHEAVHEAVLGLPVAVDATHGLTIVARIPGRIEDHNTVGADQIDAQTASPEEGNGKEDLVSMSFN